MRLGPPQNHNKDGFGGSNSIMVVYMEPLGKYGMNPTSDESFKAHKVRMHGTTV